MGKRGRKKEIKLWAKGILKFYQYTGKDAVYCIVYSQQKDLKQLNPITAHKT